MGLGIDIEQGRIDRLKKSVSVKSCHRRSGEVRGFCMLSAASSRITETHLSKQFVCDVTGSERGAMRKCGLADAPELSIGPSSPGPRLSVYTSRLGPGTVSGCLSSAVVSVVTRSGSASS